MASTGYAKPKLKDKDKVKSKSKPAEVIAHVEVKKEAVAVKLTKKVEKSAKKYAYKFVPDWRKDKYDLYPQLIGKYASRDSYFGYMDEQIEIYDSMGDYDKATELANKYTNDWNRLYRPPPKRRKRK